MKAETVKKRIEGTLKGYFTPEKLHSLNAYERRLLDLLRAADLQVDYVIREEAMRSANTAKPRQPNRTEPAKETDSFPGDLPEAEDNIKIPELDD